MSYMDDLRGLFDQCCQEHGVREMAIEDFWDWCKKNDKWSLPPDAEYKIFHRDVQQSLRTSEYVNQQGERVRSYGNFKDKTQRHLWFDIRTAKRARALAFFSEMYSGWQADGQSIRKQIENWNNNIRSSKEKAIEFDFMLSDDEGESAA